MKTFPAIILAFVLLVVAPQGGRDGTTTVAEPFHRRSDRRPVGTELPIEVVGTSVSILSLALLGTPRGKAEKDPGIRLQSWVARDPKGLATVVPPRYLGGDLPKASLAVCLTSDALINCE